MASIAQHIPADIICEIFAYFSTTFTPTCDSSDNDFPWYLGHICLEWRNTFMSMTPQFWGRIGMGFGGIAPDPRKVERITSMLTFFLERNAGKPFDLDYTSIFSESQEYNKISHFFEILADESMRWSDVSLMLSVFEMPVLYRVMDRLPLMHTLYLTGKMSNFLPEEPLNDVFASAPSLSHLELYVGTRDWNFNWSLLTHLRLWGAPGKSSLGILSQAVNLKRLTIDKLGGLEDGNAQVITFPHLEYLEGVKDITLLKNIKAPALQELHLWYLHSPPGSEIIVSFLYRSKCKLMRLVWEGMTSGGKEMDTLFLHHTPELMHLVLRDLWIQSTLVAIRSLNTPSQGAEYSAHRLESLEVGLHHHYRPHNMFHCHTREIFEELSILVLARSRRRVDKADKPNGRLHSLILGIEPDMPLPPQGEKLRTLCKELGVQLRFRSLGE